MAIANSRNWERGYPYLGGVAIAFLAFILQPRIPSANTGALAATVANVSTILVAFAATTQSIFFAIGGSKRIKNLRLAEWSPGKNYFDLLLGYLTASLMWPLLALCLALLCLLIDGDTLVRIITSMAAAAFGIALLTFVRLARVVLRLMKLSDE